MQASNPDVSCPFLFHFQSLPKPIRLYLPVVPIGGARGRGGKKIRFATGIHNNVCRLPSCNASGMQLELKKHERLLV